MRNLIKIVSFILASVVLATASVVTTDAATSQNTNIYHRRPNSQKKIALTFDDGPHPKYTREILDILDEYGIKATFFVIGVNADNYPDTLEETVRRGHEIGNHTYTHPHVSYLNTSNLKNELEKCESAIFEHTDYHTKLFRPPEGMIDAAVKNVTCEMDYKVILWNIDTRDWAHTPSEDIAKNVLNNVKSGDIILMHDYIFNSPTPKALRMFLPKLIEEGYKFVVISELIGLDE